MSLTVAQARDEILAKVKAAWDTTSLPMLWEDVPGAPPNTGAWARTTLRHTAAGQGTLANHEGRRRWRRMGILTVQIFVAQGRGLAQADDLGKVLTDVLEGGTTPGGVWFRNVRAVEIGSDGAGWQQTNVLAEFQYDEVR